MDKLCKQEDRTNARSISCIGSIAMGHPMQYALSEEEDREYQSLVNERLMWDEYDGLDGIEKLDRAIGSISHDKNIPPKIRGYAHQRMFYRCFSQSMGVKGAVTIPWGDLFD